MLEDDINKIKEQLAEHENILSGLFAAISSLEQEIVNLEKELKKVPIGDIPSEPPSFKFKDPTKHHSNLLRELLSSDFTFKRNGLTYTEILDIFKLNKRPVSESKIKDLLRKWVERKRCDTTVKDDQISYFITSKQGEIA